MGVDREGFTRLYEELYPRVLAYAMRRVRPEDACDAVDETFLIAWRKRSVLPAEVLPWLLVTARNTLANQQRGRRHQNVVAAEVAREVGHGMGVDAEAAVVERIRVLSALAQLTERERDALMVTVWDGLSGPDAARVAGCSAVAFTVRLHRARRRFADALQRWDSQPHDSVDAGPVSHVRSRQVVPGKDVR